MAIDGRAIEQAIARAVDYLRAEAEGGFAETRHVMRFPRASGFSTERDAHVAGPFARAVIAGALLDVGERLGDADSAAIGASREGGFAEWAATVARREAEHLALCRLTDRAGGWSYFPTLPELPPDLDSLAAAIALFARAAPDLLPLCEEPIAMALTAMDADGGIETWLVAERDPDVEAMRGGIAEHWGRGADLDVCARFFHALALADRARFGDAVARGAHFVRERQRADGGWSATWYWGEAQACDLAMRFLRGADDDSGARARASRFLLDAQREDGGWGVWESVPLDTALALGTLADTGVDVSPDAIARGVESLLSFQTLGGFWKGTPWIKMDIGRATGTIARTATYKSAAVTTAFCLRALAACARPALTLERRHA